MKTLIRFSALVLLSLTAACGDGSSDVTVVQIENGVWAEIRGGETLRVEGDVRTERQGNVLVVRPERHDGVALVKVPFFVKEIRTRGNAEVAMRPMRLDYLSLDAAGTSTITVTGVTTDMSVYIRGNAVIDASDMNARHVDIDASGSSEAAVWVTESIAGTVGGSAEVTVIGEGDATGLATDGSASVTFLPEPDPQPQ